MGDRLHKVLAQHGLGSRREVERWITEGRIQLNGSIARTGDAFASGDRVLLDGRDITKRLDRQVPAQVLCYHKPQGQPIDQDERRATPPDREPTAAGVERGGSAETVMSRLPALRGSRWVAINPMHAGDSGLLLLTNDGALSYALTRQKKWIPTSYLVRVHVRGGVPNAPVLPTTLRLDEGEVQFSKVAVVGDPLEQELDAGNVWYQVDMARADKRAAVRALFVSHSLTISRMMQIAFGPITLTKEIPRARHIAATAQQLEQLYTLAQLPLPQQPGVLTGKFSGKPHKKFAARAERDAEAAPTKRAATAGVRHRSVRDQQPSSQGHSAVGSRRRPPARRPS